MRKPFKWLAAGVLTVLIAACIKDELNLDHLQYDISPEFGVKLASATLSMKDLISHFDENGLVQDSGGTLSIIYRDRIATVNATEVITVPNQYYDLGIALSENELSFLMANDSVEIERYFEVEFSLDNADDVLDSLQITSAATHIAFNTSAASRGYIAILHPETGSALWETEFQDLQQPYGVSENGSIANTTLHYHTTSGGSSALRVFYRVRLYAPVVGDVSLIQLQLSMTDVNYKGIFGQLAPRTLDLLNSTVAVDLFNSDFDGTFLIANPTLHFFVTNSFGIKADFSVHAIYGYREEMQVFELQDPFPGQIPVIPPAPAPYAKSETDFVFENNTTNPPLSELMLHKPQELGAGITAQLAAPAGENTFVTDSSKLQVELEARFPLYGYINDFHFVDTTTADFDGIAGEEDQPSEVQSAMLRMFVTNGLPLDVQVQILFLDSNLQVLDSLFQQQQLVVQSAPVDHSVSPTDPDYGRATGTTLSTTDINMDRTRLDKLAATAYMIVDVAGSTTGNQPNNVRIFSADAITISLSAKAQFNFTGDE